jgi:hypothetical protein
MILIRRNSHKSRFRKNERSEIFREICIFTFTHTISHM